MFQLWYNTSDLFGNHFYWVITYNLSIFLLLACLGPDCKIHSLNNKGPCINGGNLTCNGDEVAPAIKCTCPPHYKGNFCEDKMENVIVFITLISFFLSTCSNLFDKHKCKHDSFYIAFLSPYPVCIKFQITRLCDIISNASADTLKNCNVTKEDCITYSRNRRYAFKCYKTETSQERGGGVFKS